MGEAAAVGEERSRGDRGRAYIAAIASSTLWPVIGFLSSAVKMGNAV